MNCPPPYRPLRGAEPPHFVDRPDEENLGAMGIRAASIAAYLSGPGDPRFHQLVVAGPAMGKTALLRAIGRQAAYRLDWAVTFHHCRPKERALGTVVAEVVRSMQSQWPGQSALLTSEVMGPRLKRARPRRQVEHAAGVGLVPAPHFLVPEAEATWSTLKELLELGGRFASRLSRGLLVMFDDADLLGGGEVESLGHLARSLLRDGLPIALMLSGGQQLAERFHRMGNFSGSVWPTGVDRFDDIEAREALVVPANDRGVDFEDKALELLCAAAGGSPFELQRLGFAAWSAAREGNLITALDVARSIRREAPELAAKAS
jgi:hypothetical protein